MLSQIHALEHDFAHAEQVRLFGADLLRRMRANPLIAPWLDRQLARLRGQYRVEPIRPGGGVTPWTGRFGPVRSRVNTAPKACTEQPPTAAAA